MIEWWNEGKRVVGLDSEPKTTQRRWKGTVPEHVDGEDGSNDVVSATFKFFMHRPLPSHTTSTIILCASPRCHVTHHTFTNTIIIIISSLLITISFKFTCFTHILYSLSNDISYLLHYIIENNQNNKIAINIILLSLSSLLSTK